MPKATVWPTQKPRTKRTCQQIETMPYSSQDVNRLLQDNENTESRVVCVHWAHGDHVEAFREDSKRIRNLFLHLNYPFVQEYAIPDTNSEVRLEEEIWRQLRALRGVRSVFIIYYGGHGEKGGRGRWVA